MRRVEQVHAAGVFTIDGTGHPTIGGPVIVDVTSPRSERGIERSACAAGQ